MKAMILAGAAAALLLVSGCSNPKVFPPPAAAPAKVHKTRPLLPEERVSVDPLPPAFREGRIVVRAVRGHAWSMGAEAWTPVKINMVLQAGAVIATEEESGVDLFAAINGPFERHPEGTAGMRSYIISSHPMEPYQFLFASSDSFESGLRRAQSARGVFDPLGRLSPPSFQAPTCGFQVFEGFLDCD
jgi:hypothetical protein